ncbi:hypothetical protein P7K49_011508 [Saguinus oedipus]|uniref:Uncharacterized protein n=1 Tax=Saguinus oedipus TaxID=9490 RepID=A0ABQ9VR62_SAGOE|nr:hypothetical protein P7K49_011508 [Saguinus oedipus]
MKAEFAGESRAELASLARSLAPARPRSSALSLALTSSTARRPPPAACRPLPGLARPRLLPLAPGELAGAQSPRAPVCSAPASCALSPSAASRAIKAT